MPQLRSKTTTSGRNMAGARALWRATGVKDSDFGKPIIAVSNSFTQFVPGHVHLKDLGQLVCREIEKAGAIAKEFNTIAVDDGIAMGHGGMLYSLPSRDIISDSVEYMVNAHCADALVCISNCDKITPGMLNATMRLNIPTIFVSGGPMEAGKVKATDLDMAQKGSQVVKLDLVDAMMKSADDSITDEQSETIERSACPTCGSCSGMFTANSMNCLTEALGLALPGNGSVLATHAKREELFLQAARQIVINAKKYYFENDESVLPRNIANQAGFQNAMKLDIAMGGSTNTILHLLAAAQEGEIDFGFADIDTLSRKVPTLCKIAPSSSYHMEDFHRAGGVLNVLAELADGKLLQTNNPTVLGKPIGEVIEDYRLSSASQEVRDFYKAAPGGVRTTQAFSQNQHYKELDEDRQNGCIRSVESAYNQDGGLCVLFGNLAQKGAVVKTAGVDESIWLFEGRARVFESQEDAMNAILENQIIAGDIVVIRYEGPKGGPGMQEMLYPTTYLKSKGLGKACALITDGRFSGGTSGLSIGHMSPEAAGGGNLALVEEGDTIEINIPERALNLKISDEEMKARRAAQEQRDKPFTPKNRQREVSKALRYYAHFVSSADLGAIRQLD